MDTPSSPEMKERAFPRWLGWSVCFIILAAVFAAYRPVWSAQFLWDDGFLVLRNPLIRSPLLVGEVFLASPVS